jgi:hypothetical protein
MNRERQLPDEEYDRFKLAYRLLEHLGAQYVKHSGRTLIQHLPGTWRILSKEAEREPVCLAGLYHSIYGTNFFKTSIMEPGEVKNRALIQSIIGDEAEHLAYLFCTIDRPYILLNGAFGGPERQDLLTIEIANLLEQAGLRGVTNTFLGDHQ